jgi:hypothetical protein
MIKPHLTLIVNIKFFSQSELLPFPFKIFMPGKEIFEITLQILQKRINISSSSKKNGCRKTTVRNTCEKCLY